MAPEIARCQYKQSPEDRASPATDMFSLGVIAYMLVSGGREPFWDGSDVRCFSHLSTAIFLISDLANDSGILQS